MWLIGTFLYRIYGRALRSPGTSVRAVILQLISDFSTNAPTERTRFSVIRLSARASRDASALVV